MKSINTKNRLSKLLKVIFLTLSFYIFILYFNFLNVYSILIVVSVFFVYIFLKKYLWILLILIIPFLTLGEIIYIQIRPGWIYEMSVSEILIILSFVVFTINIFINNSYSKVKFDKIAFLLASYLLISLFYIFSIDYLRIYVYALKVIFYQFIVYFLAINLINSKERFKYFLYALSATVLILIIQMLIKLNSLGFSTSFFLDRSSIFIPIGAIAYVSSILVLILPIILMFYFYSKEKIKPFLLILFILGCLPVFLIMGKAAIISLFAGLFFIFLVKKDKRIIFTLLFLLAIVSSYIIFTPFFIGFTDRVSTTAIDPNTQYRITEYKVGTEVIKNNLIFGIGPGQQLEYYNEALNLENNNKLVNNFILQILIDYGLVGLIIFFILVIVLYKKIKKSLKNVNNEEKLLIWGLIASIIVAFLNGLAEVTFFGLQYAIIFWFIIGAFNVKLEKNI